MDKKYDWVLVTSSSEYDTFGLAFYKNYTAKEIKEELANYIAEEAKETDYTIYDATTNVDDIKEYKYQEEDPTDFTGHIDFDDFHYSYSMIRMDTIETKEQMPMYLCKCGGEVELDYLGGTYFTKCQECENIIKLKAVSSGGAVMEWNNIRKKEDEEEQKKLGLLITRAQECCNNLDTIWDQYFTLYPDEEDYCSHINNLFYDLEDMIDHMKEKRIKDN